MLFPLSKKISSHSHSHGYWHPTSTETFNSPSSLFHWRCCRAAEWWQYFYADDISLNYNLPIFNKEEICIFLSSLFFFGNFRRNFLSFRRTEERRENQARRREKLQFFIKYFLTAKHSWTIIKIYIKLVETFFSLFFSPSRGLGCPIESCYKKFVVIKTRYFIKLCST